MNVYTGTLGQLVIVEFFVLLIWLKVLFDVIRVNDNSVIGRRLLLTSLGLVLNAGAIIGIMSFRIYELIQDKWPFIWGIVAFYMMLACGNILFIVSATLGNNTRYLKAFVITTLAWSGFVFYLSYF